MTQVRQAERQRLLAGAVDELSKRTGFPVSFGGLFESGLVRIGAIHGARTSALDDLAVRPERGLGGKAFIEKRPRMAGDYRTARQITHDYDRQVLGEGIGALLAVPVIVAGVPRGVLYGGAWGQWGIGGITATSAVEVADRLAARLSSLGAPASPGEEAPAPTPEPTLSPTHQEELRASYAELRRIAAAVDDPSIRARIEGVERRLAVLSGAMPSEDEAPDPVVHLTPRETDVLACAALGATNALIATELSLREGTVKAYLGSAMAKLDAPTRVAAVAKARRAGILP